MHGKEIEKFGFDLLDEGIPYLNGELTEAYKEIMFQQNVEDFKKNFPVEAKELFDGKPKGFIVQDVYTVDTEEESTQPDLWLEYLKLDSNTRALHPADRKQKEIWFRHIPEKQQLRLIELYKKAS